MGNNHSRSSSKSRMIYVSDDHDEAPPAYSQLESSASHDSKSGKELEPQRDVPSRVDISKLEYESNEERLETFKKLAQFDTAIVLDDSGSMNDPVRRYDGPSRWEEAKQALAVLAEDCAEYDNDGIDIHFLNHTAPADQATGKGFKSADAVRKYINKVSPSGTTPIGAKLDDILSAYMRVLESGKPTKLLNILVITDGGASDPIALKLAIANVTRNLDKGNHPLRQIGIQFVQIGTDVEATEFLGDLDNNLTNDANPLYRATRDIVDTVICSGKGGKLDAALLLKILTGGINRDVDNKNLDEIKADSAGTRVPDKKDVYYY